MIDPLTDDARLVLAFIGDHRGLTLEELVRHLGMNTNRLSDALKQLQFNGVVISGPTDRSHLTIRFYPV